MKIYTKTGDRGKTALIGGKRVQKNDPRIDAIGTVDELNSFLGLIRSEKIPKKIDLWLEKIQNDLFAIGGTLADARKNSAKKNPLPSVAQADISFLEKNIDEMWKMLPELRNFILPGGTRAASLAYIARAVCRRSERTAFNIKFPKQKREALSGPKIIDNFSAGPRTSEKSGFASFERSELYYKALILPYLNRLSDFLFALGRFLNFTAKKKETIWKGIHSRVE